VLRAVPPLNPVGADCAGGNDCAPVHSACVGVTYGWLPPPEVGYIGTDDGFVDAAGCDLDLDLLLDFGIFADADAEGLAACVVAFGFELTVAFGFDFVSDFVFLDFAASIDC
jgi:hypothetical protein